MTTAERERQASQPPRTAIAAVDDDPGVSRAAAESAPGDTRFQVRLPVTDGAQEDE